MILMLAVLGLSAQVVRLPDVDVLGIETTRSFIYKSNILPLIQSLPLDSLFLSLPHTEQPQAFLPKTRKPDQRDVFLDLGLSSKSVAYMNIALMFDSLDTSGMQFRMQQFDPGKQWSYQRYDLFINPALNNSLHAWMDYKLAQFEHVRDEVAGPVQFHKGLMSAAISARYPKLKFETVEVRDIRNLLSLLWMQTERDTIAQDRLYANLDTSFDLKYWRYDFTGRIALVYWQPALQAEMDLNPVINLGQAEESAIGFMTDRFRFVPYLAFRYEYSPSLNSRIILVNQPRLKPPDLEPFFECYYWFDFADDLRQTKTPLNLRLAFSCVDLPLTWHSWDYFSIENHLSYSIDAPYIGADQPLDPVPTFTYGNIAVNTTQLNLAGEIRETRIQQSLGGQFSYLCCQEFSRVPYQPLYFAQTRISRMFGETNCTLTIDQKYNRIDHKGRALPEFIDLSLGFERDLMPGLTISTAIKNILGSHPHSYLNLPQNRASAELRLRYIF